MCDACPACQLQGSNIVCRNDKCRLIITESKCRRLHLPVNALAQTCFQVTSNVWVSGVKLWSFPAQPEVLLLDTAQREDVFYNQQERKKLSERRPTCNDLWNQVKELAQDYSFSEVGQNWIRVQFQKSLSTTLHIWAGKTSKFDTWS